MSKFRKLKSLYVLVGILIFSFLFPGELPAKDKKKGAKLIVFKTQSGTIEGELLTVKESTLILMTPYKTEERVSIDEVKEIRVKRKNKLLKSFLIGGLAGFATGAIFGVAAVTFDNDKVSSLKKAYVAVLFGGMGALPGLLVGGITSGFFRDYEKIKPDQANESGRAEILAYLNKIARYRN